MTPLITPRPSNLVSTRQVPVESDVYNICMRVQELDPNLRIVLHENHPKPWVVMERGPDGEERFVSRYEELDARIIENLRYMQAVPLEKRIDELQRQADAENAKHGMMSEERFEKFAYDFQKALVDSNMSNPVWGRSYRNTNKKGRE